MSLEGDFIHNLKTVATLSIKNGETWHKDMVPIIQQMESGEWKSLSSDVKRAKLTELQEALDRNGIREAIGNYPAKWSREQFGRMEATLSELLKQL